MIDDDWKIRRNQSEIRITPKDALQMGETTETETAMANPDTQVGGRHTIAQDAKGPASHGSFEVKESHGIDLEHFVWYFRQLFAALGLPY